MIKLGKRSNENKTKSKKRGNSGKIKEGGIKEQKERECQYHTALRTGKKY